MLSHQVKDFLVSAYPKLKVSVVTILFQLCVQPFLFCQLLIDLIYLYLLARLLNEFVSFRIQIFLTN